ncbi:MAG: hypothetical protein HRT45_12545 [Bdellovibrionales bacterium]|nr:hypothetical protein [Bdellovibrionales bacterium]
MATRFVVFSAVVLFLSIGVTALAEQDPAESGRSCRDEIAKTSLEQADLTLPSENYKAYVEGEGAVGQIWRLNKQDYRDLVAEERLPTDAILILEDIDLEIDMPLVAGIILSKPLAAEGTHIQVLCRKMGIPLIYSKNYFEDLDMVKAAMQREAHFRLVATSTEAKLRATEESQVSRKLKRALPVALSDEQLSAVPYVVFSEGEDNLPREIVGDKFFPLDLVKAYRCWNRSRMKVASLTSRFFYEFLKGYYYENRSLASWMYLTREGTRHWNSQGGVSTILEKPREAFRNATASPEFQEVIMAVHAEVLRELRLEEGSLSVRSNNDVENLIAAGLYKSSRTEDLSFEAFEKSIKEVYASMLTARAYQIRGAWGLREENLRMPVLLHEYLDGEAFNATARIQRGANGRGMKARVTIVMGENTNATNPASGSEVYTIYLQSESAEFEVTEISGNIEAVHLEPVQRLLNELRMDLQRSLYLMRINSQSVYLEFASIPRPHWQQRPMVRLFQYQPSYPREVVFDVLNGVIKQSDLDIESVDIGANPSLSTIVEELMAEPLFLVDENALPSNSRRYALVAIDGDYQILVWSSGQHESMRDRFKAKVPNGAWLRSGYLGLSDDKQSIAFYRTAARSVDPDLQDEWSAPGLTAASEGESYLLNAYEAAISSAILQDHAFAKSFDRYNGIEIHGKEKLWRIGAEQLLD